MPVKNKSNVLNAILTSAIVVFCFLVVLITFVDLPFIPTWQEISGRQAKIDKVSDCVIHLNVGEGDATLIKSNNRYALIDTGDGISANVINKLKDYGVNGLDALILTHWHSDHIGAAAQILDEFQVLNIVVTKLPDSTSELYADAKEIVDKAESKNIKYSLARQGLVINIGDFRLSVLYSDPEEDSDNNKAAIIMAKCHGFKFLFMADVDCELEEKLISDGYIFDCDVIKVGHHGSKNSTSSNLLKEATPRYGVISVGANNVYNHPSGALLDQLYYADINILRTDIHGDITFTVDENDISVKNAVS